MEIIKNSKRLFFFFKRNTTNFISIGRLVDQKDQMTILGGLLNYLKRKQIINLNY